MPTKDTPHRRSTPTRQLLTLSRIERLSLPAGQQEVVLWDKKCTYLGVRLRSGKKTFIYYRKVNGRPLRLSLGSVSSLTIEQARREAERIGGLISQGIDPREEKRQRLEAAEAKKRERERAKSTFGRLWDAYVEANASGWSESHLKDHAAVMTRPGQQRQRSKKKTVAGVLWPLRDVLLSELSQSMMESHMAKEAAKRPTTTAKAFRLLRACLRWGQLQPEYEGLYDADKLAALAGKKVAKASNARNKVLERQQLAAWFNAMQTIREPAHRAYLQTILLTGARPGEVRALCWDDVDFQWNTLTLRDKCAPSRVIPLTPYLRELLQSLPRRNKYVFSSGRTNGPIAVPAKQNEKALQAAGLPHLTPHDLRRSFGSLAEWMDIPAGVVPQIMGHKPSATAERHYRVRPVDLLRQWHTQIEAWILEHAGMKQPPENSRRLEVVK